MATDDQSSLFEEAIERGLDPRVAFSGGARAEFLAGMLGAWLYGDKTVPKQTRESLLGLAGRTLAEADRIKELRP